MRTGKRRIKGIQSKNDAKIIKLDINSQRNDMKTKPDKSFSNTKELEVNMEKLFWKIKFVLTLEMSSANLIYEPPERIAPQRFSSFSEQLLNLEIRFVPFHGL